MIRVATYKRWEEDLFDLIGIFVTNLWSMFYFSSYLIVRIISVRATIPPFNKYSKNVLISSYNRTYIIIILSNVTDNPSKSRTLIKDWLQISQLNQINLLLIFYILPPLSCHALHFVVMISILCLRYWRKVNSNCLAHTSVRLRNCI